MNQLGHNRPDFASGITGRLPVDYENYSKDVDAAEQAMAQLPDTIETQEMNSEFADLVTRIRSIHKSIEGTRVDEKEPYLRAERAVDGFFAPLKKRLDDTKVSLERRITDYLNRKAAEERRQREAKEREELEKAEALRREEEARTRKAEEASRQDHRDLHNRKADAAAYKAQQHEQAAHVASVAAAEKPADLARERSAKGSLSTLKEEWSFKVEDYHEIPLDQLRAYFPTHVVDKAVKAFVKNGGRQLKGVDIFETNKAMVR